ncbi:MAG TPA: isocitrate lyase/phosphoenolpyruvate mutase family protein [Ilumatobacter sp.]|jgi:2-methylisocitrate lyase-like PEP mutase family enzyme|nr:isocitrate lyase/phosphoenolpyruvate mutase family protein [Ilumatobacter sp.]
MTATQTAQQRRARFFELHARPEVFVIPNPYDVGSAKMLAHAGFEALATTSAGFAWSQGVDDGDVTFEQLLDHVRAIAAAVDVPLNVDSERLFADDPDGVAANVTRLHEAGAAGCSIEDWNGTVGAIEPVDVAAERVAAAARAAHVDGDPLVLTARCENLLHGVPDLDDTIARLCAYRDAGADCVYAPGLSTAEQIKAVVDAVGVPVNVLAWPTGPSVPEIGRAGGRRVSTGSALASTAYGALMAGARELLESGTSAYLKIRLRPEDRAALRG